MAKVNKEEISIFLASSAELRKDREKFADFVMDLQKHYSKRGLGFQLEKWEYLDPAYNGRRKQDEYNDVIKKSDVFVALFHNKAGRYTLEEFDLAVQECQTRQLPLFIYFREQTFFDKLKNGTAGLKPITDRIAKLKHFWGSYGTNDKLHLDFVLWLDSYIFDGKSPIKVENGHVMLEDIKVADMSGLSFAANNDAFKQMFQEIQDYPAKIEKLRKRTEKFPDEQDFKDELQQTINNYNALTKEFERYQQTLLDTAKFIADRKHEQSSEKLQRAIDAFESGDMAGANAILKEIEIEAEREGHLEHFERQKNISDKAQEVVHQDIYAFQLQAKTEMADVKIPIQERITRVAEIYAKADDWASRSDYDKEKYAKLLFDYASFLDDYAHYDEAIKIYQRQIALSEDIYDKDSTDTATSYNNIGLVYMNQGDYDKALEFYFKALVIDEKVLGTEHSDTATSYNNIAGVYYSKGDYDKALEYFFKALEIDEKVLGTEHSDTATSYNNIGSVYMNQGDYDKALEYYFKALDIVRKVLGELHPYTASTYNNIGLVYMNQGEYDKALEFYFKALDIREKVLGKEHPNTATSYNCIGGVYKIQGIYDKALEYYFKALDIREKVLGKEHPDTATSYNNIGSVYMNQGDYDKALEYYFKALDIREKVLGKEHPDTATSYNNIGLVYWKQGDYDKALEYHFKALGIREKVLGKEHPDTATSYNNIGLVYMNQGDYDKALEYYEKALAILLKVLGPEHPKTKTVQENINFLKLMKELKKMKE